jgi:iron complex outermembrane recepter protein
MKLAITTLTRTAGILAICSVLQVRIAQAAQNAEPLGTPTRPAPGKTIAFQIPAQPLANALIDFSRQSGMQVSYQPELAMEKSTAPLAGNYTAEAALKMLLTNSGLAPRFSGTTATLERVAAQNPPTTARPKPVAAQQPTGEPTITLPPVTVQEIRENYAVDKATTGTKIEAPLMDIPQSIQVVPRQVIEDQRAVNLSDVLRNVSGFSPSVNSQSQRFGERDTIFRGFTGNNYYTNGFKDPFNGNSFSAGMANIDRVEVLKGPASVLYGLGDPNATVNILTKQPLSEWYASGEMTGARFAMANPNIDVSGPLTPGRDLRFRFNAGYQYQDSFVDYVKSQRFLVAPVLSWSIGPNTTFTAEGEYQEIGEIYYTGLPGQGTISPNINGKINRSRYLGDKKLEGDDFPERLQGKVGYRLEHRFNDHVSLRHGFRATLFNIDERDVIPIVLDTDERTMFRELFTAKTSRYDYYALTDLNLDFKTGPFGHKFLVGSDQRFNSFRARTASAEIDPIDVFDPVYGNIIDPITPDTPRNLTSSQGTFFGVYLQDLIHITDQIKFLAGVRYDNAYQKSTFRVSDSPDSTRSKLDENVFTPRAGLVYQPFPWLSLYGSYSKSFVPQEGTTRTGSALKPETGEQWESGLKFEFFDGRLTSTLAAYHLTKQNVTATDPDPDFSEFSVQIGEQRSRGFEFDLAGEVFPGFRLITSYAFTDAKILKSAPLFDIDVEGNRRANVPKHSGTLWGIYGFQEGSALHGLSLGLGIIGVGKRPSDDFATEDLPGYVRTDAALQYRFSRNFDVALNFKNLFNKKYFETSTFGVWENGISPGAPFTMFGTIRFRY